MGEWIFGHGACAFRNFCRVVGPRVEAFTHEIETELKQRNANAGPPTVEEIKKVNKVTETVLTEVVAEYPDLKDYEISEVTLTESDFSNEMMTILR